MRGRSTRPERALFSTFSIAAAVALAAVPAPAQEAKSASGEAKGGPVVRTFGAAGGCRTEVTSETKGALGREDRGQVALLTAQVFQHVDEARRAIDADDVKLARKEVAKGREAMRAIRTLLPRTTVRTRTTAADGKVIYEDEREVQEDRVPLFEGMLSAQTLAPITAAKRDAVEVAGVRLVGAETITTEVIADLDLVDRQLTKAANSLDANQPEAASKALATAQVRGVDFRYRQEDTPLAEARDAIWLARRALEENNAAQAQANLNVARERLRVYREVAPKGRRPDVDRMLQEVEQLDGQLRQETNREPATPSERARQGNAVVRWWNQVNDWFRKQF